MALKHGKDTFISLDGNDISYATNQSELDVNADEHDVTCYGADDHEFGGGLLAGGMSMGGMYDDGVAGPKAVIEPLIGTNVTLIRRPIGTGSGRPQESMSVHVRRYVETNPVAGYITWAAELTKSGPVTRTTQA